MPFFSSLLNRFRLSRGKKAANPSVRPSLARALESAMHDEKRAPEFFLALLEGSLWTLSQKSKLAQFADAEGKSFIPIFSDREFLPTDLPTDLVPVQMPGKEAFAQARGIAPLVLNPGQSRFKLFGLVDIDRILDRLVTPASIAKTPVALPKEEAPSLLRISSFTDEDWKLIGRHPADPLSP